MKHRKRGGLLAIVLILAGCVFLLNQIGVLAGSWASYLVPLALVGAGYFALNSGRTLLGLAVGGLGALLLLGKLASGLIVVLIAAALIGYGLSLLKKKRSA
ncbi:LiaF transmembrane domain-containing protein [Paenibacillus hamazuiensis]|uniref:LiaF transmembrane domain-containing protein n=1 Tax=Paenibacillus hamazuiensis TaxID=2936508 RepID=UPI0020105836|nr:DUF5668 domain-containing protein [Paenibacillus hamazuiensis]